MLILIVLHKRNVSDGILVGKKPVLIEKFESEYRVISETLAPLEYSAYQHSQRISEITSASKYYSFRRLKPPIATLMEDNKTASTERRFESRYELTLKKKFGLFGLTKLQFKGQ